MINCIFYDNSFSVKTHKHIAECEKEWNPLTVNAEHLHSSNLAGFENSKLDNFEFRYLLIYKKEKLAGIAYFQILHFKKDHYTAFKLNNVILKKIESAIISSDLKIFNCGNFFRINFQGFNFNKKLMSSEEFCTIMKNWTKDLPRKERPSLTVFKDVDPKFNAPEVFIESGLKEYPEDLTMELEIREDWYSLEDYKNSLTKKYAQRVTKTLKDFEEVERREFSLKEIEKYKTEIITLYENVMKKQTIKLGILNINYFLEFKKQNGNNFKLFGYFLHGKLIAFTSNIIHKNIWEVHYIGLDYEYATQLKTYQHILLDGVSDAITARKHVLDLGRTAKEAKAILGCAPAYYNNFYYVRGTFAKLIFNYLLKNFKDKEGEEWRKRNPFKNQIPELA